MITQQTINIFKKGSRTYFYSSLFFPKEIRDDVFILYSFVRTADDMVDVLPQQKKEFLQFRNQTLIALETGSSTNPIIDNFIAVYKKRAFKKQWVVSFLNAIKTDLTKKSYPNLGDLEEYMHGSAEVIGLMMAKVMNLSPKSHPYAAALGKSMQYINFIRDIEEDLTLNRVYFPKQLLKKSNLKGFEIKYLKKNPVLFKNFVRKQIMLYRKWQEYSERGFKYIPADYLPAIKTASEMYKWTADQIYTDPGVIFKKKIKPSIARIIYTALKNSH